MRNSQGWASTLCAPNGAAGDGSTRLPQTLLHQALLPRSAPVGARCNRRNLVASPTLSNSASCERRPSVGVSSQTSRGFGSGLLFASLALPRFRTCEVSAAKSAAGPASDKGPATILLRRPVGGIVHPSAPHAGGKATRRRHPSSRMRLSQRRGRRVGGLRNCVGGCASGPRMGWAASARR